MHGGPVIAPLAHLRILAKDRPPGYMEDVISQGTIDGDHVVLTQEAWDDLCAKYRGTGPPLLEMLANFGESLQRWNQAGRPVVTQEEFRRRLDGCQGTGSFATVGRCLNWDPDAYGGRGRCLVCGCTDLKLYLATDECPLPEPLKRWRKAEESALQQQCIS